MSGFCLLGGFSSSLGCVCGVVVLAKCVVLVCRCGVILNSGRDRLESFYWLSSRLLEEGDKSSALWVPQVAEIFSEIDLCSWIALRRQESAAEQYIFWMIRAQSRQAPSLSFFGRQGRVQTGGQEARQCCGAAFHAGIWLKHVWSSGRLPFSAHS
jgi:hypothetical protein